MIENFNQHTNRKSHRKLQLIYKKQSSKSSINKKGTHLNNYIPRKLKSHDITQVFKVKPLFCKT